MRERAERIGAKLRVFSSPGAGTEVELAIPSHLAFESYTRRRTWHWLSRLHFPGSGGAAPASNELQAGIQEKDVEEKDHES